MTIISAYNVANISGQRVLYDTNIWIMLEGFSPNMREPRVGAYEQAHRQLLKNRNIIVVTDIVVMEFFNRCCKLNYEFKKGGDEHNPIYETYKTYRCSSEYPEDAAAVVDSCMRIVEEHEYEPTEFKQNALIESIIAAGSGAVDMNDYYIASVCMGNSYIVMSDDRDIYDERLSMITANRKLLKKCT